MKRGVVWAILLSLVGVGGVLTAGAATFNSSNFSINGNLGDSVAGGQASTNYQLTSAGGESIAGSSSSKSYKLGQGYMPTLENSLQLVTQPSSLVGYYPFEEGTGGSVYDESQNNNHGSFVGSPSRVTGKLNQGIELTGGSDYVEVGNYSVSGNSITLSAWVYGSPRSGEARIISKATSQSESDHTWLLGLGSGAGADDKLRVRLKTAGVVSTFSTGNLGLSDNTWYHASCTYDGSNVRIYLNGVEVGSFPKTGDLDINSAPVRIGSGDNGSGGASAVWDGSIDEVKIFNRALSPSELKAEYSAGNAGLPAGLSLGSLTPGVSQTASFDSIVQTSAGGYTLAINQNNNLTNGTSSIAGVSGSIASPVVWNEGTTKGLGFTLFGTNATSIPGVWSSGAAYAAMPASATSFYTRTGYTAGAKDVLNMRLRADVQGSESTGNYTNQMTITGTMTP